MKAVHATPARIASPPPPPVAVMPIPSPIPLSPDFNPKKALVNFIKCASDAVKDKTITQEEVKQICIKHGVADISLLGHRLDLVPTIYVEVYELIMSRW